MASLAYRSSVRKLVVFFEESRDQWKEKCQQAKYELKLLKRKIGNLQKRHDQWKQRCQEAENQAEQLQARHEHLQTQNTKLQAQLDALSKKKRPWLLA